MQPKVNITATPPDLIPKIWDVVWPLLREAVDASLFLTAEALKAELMEDKAILFVATVNGAISGAVVVKIEDVKSKILHIIALGGKGITDWKVPMVDAMEKHRARHGLQIHRFRRDSGMEENPSRFRLR
jgi:hypothetical protein